MEAAGLASSILTFIDMSYKIAKGTYEIYQSATGVTAENAHVSNVITDLEEAAAGLGTASKGHHADFKAAIVGARKQKDIASIERGLDQYRQQIILHLTLNIHRDQSPSKAQLDRIRDDSSHLANDQHSSVRETLANCANGRKLVLVTTFFWSSGDPLQKSLERFYRTVLFHTLRQCPELLETIIPTLVGTAVSPLSAAMSLSELKAAFSRMQLLENAASYLFFYFIDGLDEYEGDSLNHKHLAEMLRKWARADNVKVICSARPSAVTLAILGASNTFFELHDLTKADIYAFAKTQFEEHLREPAFVTGQAACLGMLQTIAERADGVFLWASLVVRTLLNAVLETRRRVLYP
ncbi:hypothetical protein BDP81DRAFT_390001 [Colletotrichum phormii]|uniref:Nephrocystin 3-like N-terminal domain-containing protein n=1 Tax=Colletotrichum phormii TaxID=359342 RepID=A0AAJ0A2Q4_9PEZI|nr:uncharacterized protein BDP81DRAFT_390001 [Colletotrichum phormii]KAK1655004.1 hypothetical protein BDP81DRAFT_390001 [Colletotrichum phormii]